MSGEEVRSLLMKILVLSNFSITEGSGIRPIDTSKVRKGRTEERKDT